jgi:hypothetical protein
MPSWLWLNFGVQAVAVALVAGMQQQTFESVVVAVAAERMLTLFIAQAN